MKVYKNRFCKCGCGKRIPIKLSHKKNGIPKYIDKHQSAINGLKTRFKNGNTLGFKSGKNHPNYKSKSGYGFKKGEKPRLGIRHTEESIQKMIDNHADITGKNNPSWIDGYAQERWNAISSSLNRGYPSPIFLNYPFKGCSFHHVDEEHGLFIPLKMHKKFWHSVKTGQHIDKMNNLAYNWLWNELEQNYKKDR